MQVVYTYILDARPELPKGIRTSCTALLWLLHSSARRLRCCDFWNYCECIWSAHLAFAYRWLNIENVPDQTNGHIKQMHRNAHMRSTRSYNLCSWLAFYALNRTIYISTSMKTRLMISFSLSLNAMDHLVFFAIEWKSIRKHRGNRN